MPGLGTAVKNGRALCDLLQDLLEKHGYLVDTEVYVGFRPGSAPPLPDSRAEGRQRVDLVAVNSTGRRVAISVKYQGVAGTVEEKLPWEVLSLKKLLAENHREYAAAYIVTGGDGFRHWMKTYFEGDEFRDDMVLPGNLRVVDVDAFEILVNARLV